MTLINITQHVTGLKDGLVCECFYVFFVVRRGLISKYSFLKLIKKLDMYLKIHITPFKQRYRQESERQNN